MTRSRIHWLWVAVMTAAPLPLRAQEIELVGPLRAAPSLLLMRDATPAAWEWVYWASGGAGRLDEDWAPSAAIGAELTGSVLEYPGFPSGPYGSRLGKAELRLGPWAGAATREAGGLVEAGVTLDWGAIYHASFGTFGLRAGAGYGTFSSRHSHGVVTVTYGVRSALHRYSERGAGDPRPVPRLAGMASVARLFTTYRRTFDGVGSEWVIGLELSPGFLLPPYGGFRFIGGPPDR